MVPLAKFVAVVLYTCIGVDGCGCPIYSNVTRIGTQSCPFKYSAPISASTADPIKFLIIFEIAWMAPLSVAFSGKILEGFSLKKKNSLALLLALGTDK